MHARFCLPRDGFVLDVDVTLPERGITALFGHSGCGKSTLLRCIAGLESPEQAFLAVDDIVWEDSSTQQQLATHQRPIGYVFQEASLFPHLSVLQNLQFGQKRAAPRPSTRSQTSNCTATSMDQAIELLGITDLLSRKPQQLSGGERQRVAIARALAVHPQVLLMDEPLAALDIQRKRDILPFLERLHQELSIPVLYVTHSPAEVRRLADHLLVMESGKVIAHGSLTDTEHYLMDDML